VRRRSVGVSAEQYSLGKGGDRASGEKTHSTEISKENSTEAGEEADNRQASDDTQVDGTEAGEEAAQGCRSEAGQASSSQDDRGEEDGQASSGQAASS